MFSEGENLLLERIHSAVPGLSADALGIVWRAIKIEVARRLAVERKPVDLGFVKIIPVPWRQNWKELLIDKGDAFHDAIHDLDLLSIHKDGFIRWSIECYHSYGLLANMDRHERARSEMLGVVDYSDAILYKDTKAVMGYAVKIINQHISRSWIYWNPCPERVQCGGLRILAHHSKTDEYWNKLNPIPAQGNGPGPSTASRADKQERSPESNTNIRFSETAQDPPQAEQPGGTGADPG